MNTVHIDDFYRLLLYCEISGLRDYIFDINRLTNFDKNPILPTGFFPKINYFNSKLI